MRDAKRFEHSVCARAALGSIKTRDPVLNDLFDAEMRKQREILKDVTDPTRTHRNIDLHAVVKPGLVCARHAARVGPGESSHAGRQRGLACAATPNEDAD